MGQKVSHPVAPVLEEAQRRFASWRSTGHKETMQGHLSYPLSFNSNKVEDKYESSNPGNPAGKR